MAKIMLSEWNGWGSTTMRLSRSDQVARRSATTEPRSGRKGPREFLDARAEFTLSAFPEKYRKALTVCGTKSGRDCDKMALTGLTPVASEEASFIDRAPFEKWYSSAADLHIVYIAEVLAVRQAK